MKLYYLAGACPLVTHIALEWIGTPYEAEAVSREALKEPAFLALNPLGAAPVLQDGDFVLTQSIAILEYLAELYPSANLLGETLQERAEVRRWLAFLNADIHRNFGVVFGVQRYAHSEAAQAEVNSLTCELLLKQFAHINQHLNGRDFLGAQRSVADAYLYVVLRWAGRLGLDLSSLTNLTRVSQKLEQDPAVQAALKAEGLL